MHTPDNLLPSSLFPQGCRQSMFPSSLGSLWPYSFASSWSSSSSVVSAGKNTVGLRERVGVLGRRPVFLIPTPDCPQGPLAAKVRSRGPRRGEVPETDPEPPPSPLTSGGAPSAHCSFPSGSAQLLTS